MIFHVQRHGQIVDGVLDHLQRPADLHVLVAQSINFSNRQKQSPRGVNQKFNLIADTCDSILPRVARTNKISPQP